MGYGPSLKDAYRRAGVHVGRILKARSRRTYRSSSRPSGLVINAETARMLGITVPPSLLAIADEVIE
jgi:putative ABC transport system substrate-binding protein